MNDKFFVLIIIGAIILLFFAGVFILIFCDLWAGVRKAKKRGELRTSEAYKRTIDKLNKYYNAMIALTVVDVMQIGLIFFINMVYDYGLWMIPMFSFSCTCYIAYIEVKSIMEPSDIKEQKQQEDFKRLLIKLAENKEMREKIIGILSVEKKDDIHNLG